MGKRLGEGADEHILGSEGGKLSFEGSVCVLDVDGIIGYNNAIFEIMRIQPFQGLTYLPPRGLVIVILFLATMLNFNILFHYVIMSFRKLLPWLDRRCRHKK